MATENLEFGINVNISGNYKTAANQMANAVGNAGSQVDKLNQKIQSLEKQINTAKPPKTGFLSGEGILGIQSSLFAIGSLGRDVADVGRSIFSGLTSAFVSGIQSSADLEKSMGTLKFVFKDSFGAAQSSIKDIARRTPETEQTLTDLAARLASVGLGVNELFKPLKGGKFTGLENVAAGLTRLSSTDRARALNSISNALTDINSFQRLFNTGVSEMEKQQFSALSSEIEKSRYILGLFEKRFGGIFGPEGIGSTLIFNVQRAFGDLQTLLQKGVAPALEILSPIFQDIAIQFAKMTDDAKFMKSLGQFFKTLAGIAGTVIKFVFDLTKGVLNFIKTFPRLSSFLAFLALAGAGLLFVVGTFTAILTKIGLVIVSFQALSVALAGVGFTGFTAAGALAAMKVALIALGKASIVLVPLIFALTYIGDAIDAITNSSGWRMLLKIVDAISTIVTFTAAGFGIGSAFGGIGAIPGAVAGLLTGIGTVGFTKGGVATGAANLAQGNSITAGIPEPIKSAPVTTAQSLTNMPQNNQGVDVEEVAEKLAEKMSQRPANLNNFIMLDGKIVAQSVNKINNDNEARFPVK